METLERKLAEHPFLQGMAPEAVSFITGCASNVRFAAGDFLVREGEEADASFLIRTGALALEVHKPGGPAVQLVRLGEGEVMGWSWLFPPYRWHFDARALEDVRAFQLDGTCLRQKCESDHDVGYEIVKRLLYQVHLRLERARFQALDLYGDSGRTGSPS